MTESISVVPAVPVKSRRVSRVLTDFLQQIQGEDFTLGMMMEALGARAFGMAMLIFSLINLVVANIPGTSVIFSLPLILFSLQMICGLPRPWLPNFLAKIRLRRSSFQTLHDKVMPHLLKAEKILRPRWLILSDRKYESVLGVFCLLFSVVLALPIMFGNFMPAMGLTLISIGLMARDGGFIALGGVFGSAGVIYAVIFADMLIQFGGSAWSYLSSLIGVG